MVGMIKNWRPWPPLSSKKFEAKIVVHCLKGLRNSQESAGNLAVEIRWKGSAKINPLSSLRRRRSGERRNLTKVESLVEEDDGGGVSVCWNEEFLCVCNFSGYKGAGFLPWEVSFTLFNGLSVEPTAIATASLNLAEYISSAKEKDFEITIPLEVSSPQCVPSSPILCLSLNLRELKHANEPVKKPVASPTHGEVLLEEKNTAAAASPLKVGLEKVKIFTGLSPRDHKKVVGHEEEGSPVGSEDTEENYPLDTDSFGDSEEGVESEEGIRADINDVRKSFSYEALAYANLAGGGSYYSNTSGSEDEDWIYYNQRKSDGDDATRMPLVDESTRQSSKRGILPWGKRRLSFRSPKRKGEPLLKKGEEGGDDIDFDRRQLSSPDEPPELPSSPVMQYCKTELDSTENRSPVAEFGDDNFAVGSWELKEIVSRDGEMKLKTKVFFASIDQRDEQAAGESACAALVAVIADWFHSNPPKEMPIKSQLDSLIREGSLEWRKMCEVETYKDRFPDKHFDLETVLQAEIRPLSVSSEKSFVGFFRPEGVEDGDGFDFLKGAMSFDDIWDQVEKDVGPPSVYIVSWNDHFFVLKVERDLIYVIDTLGERLYEGCNQAFILKFDSDTTLSRSIKPTDPSPEKTEEEPEDGKQETVTWRGREACKEYIKRFLAAIPIRELLVDLKKGLMASSLLLHQRLQIEFHCTKNVNRPIESPSLTANRDDNNNNNNNSSETQPVLAG
ncbi:unnamed protein product [Cuscuta campestris]|uniref:C2 NT-type domain-containing protein n=1 Tax=Cuscuta campestris TaxID=132261 RepID=A0A484KET0_9ASTE|nr:unnamed protein product [Cuscuta campestris]